jgi:hypothetical protein
VVARLTTTDGTVTLALSRFERIEGFRGDITAAASSVTEVRASKDLWSELRGVRAPGTGITGVVAVGTRRGSFGKDFAVVHGRRPGVVVEFSGEPFQRWVVSVDDPEQVVAAVSAVAALNRPSGLG